jgi:hypothetical protein
LNKISGALLISSGFSHDISPRFISSEIVVVMLITRLIRNIVNVFFIVIVFTMIRRGVDVVEWTVFRVMLGFGSFAVLAAIIGTERLEMASLLTLIANASPHVWGKDFVDEKRRDFIGSGGGRSPRGMNRRWTVDNSRWDTVVVGYASEGGQSTSRVFHNFVVRRQCARCLGNEWTPEGCGNWSGRIGMMAAVNL